MARTAAPTNKYVVNMVAQGIPILELHMHTPFDVRKYRKTKSNDYHDGGSTNLFEVLDEVPEAIADWDTHRNKPGKQIKVENCAKRGGFTFAKMKEAHIMSVGSGFIKQAEPLEAKHASSEQRPSASIRCTSESASGSGSV